MLKPHVLKHPGARPSCVRRIALLHVQVAERRELVACVRIARCAWASAASLDACALSCALRCLQQQQQQQALDYQITMAGGNNQSKKRRTRPNGPRPTRTGAASLCWCVVVSPQLNSVVCPETQKRTEALDCYPLSGAANQHYELDCESLFPVPAGEVRNTLQERQQEERGVLKKQPCPSHSPDRHWGGEQKDSQMAIFQPVSVGRKAGATNPTDPADQSIHPSTSAPARIWPQGGLASQRWICVSGNRQSWEEAPLARRSSASTTKLMQADSHCLFLSSSHVTYAHAQRRRKRTSPSTDSPRSLLRLQHCAEAQTLDKTGPTRASPIPIPPCPPRTRRNNHPHNNTTKHTSLSALQ